MSRRNCILNLPGFSIKKTYGHNPLIIEVNYRRKARCRYCGTTQLRKKDSFIPICIQMVEIIRDHVAGKSS